MHAEFIVPWSRSKSIFDVRKASPAWVVGVTISSLDLSFTKKTAAPLPSGKESFCSMHGYKYQVCSVSQKKSLCALHIYKPHNRFRYKFCCIWSIVVNRGHLILEISSYQKIDCREPHYCSPACIFYWPIIMEKCPHI